MRAKCTGCNEVFESPTFDGFSPCNGGRIVEIKPKITRKEWKQRAKRAEGNEAAKRAEGNEAASELAYNRASDSLAMVRNNNLKLLQEKWDLIAEIDLLTKKLATIEHIQQEWWDGDIQLNVAMSEIRCQFSKPECTIPDCGCTGDKSHP